MTIDEQQVEQFQIETKRLNDLKKSSGKREWVGLTDADFTKLWEETPNYDSWELIKRVEAKLKAKNYD